MLSLIFFLIFSANAERAAVTVEDIERLSGFAEHKKSVADFDKEREAGMSADAKEKASEARAQDLAAKEQQAMPKQISPGDNKILYRQDQEERKQWDKEQNQARLEFLKQNRGLKGNPLVRSISEEEELDLINKRPRFDYKKRTLYSSRGSVVSTAPLSSRRRKKESGGTNSSNPNLAVPPSGPSYDDFPPPPPPTFGGSEGPGQEEFPPPPPAFDEFDSDFPPPPPPPPMDFPPPEN